VNAQLLYVGAAVFATVALLWFTLSRSDISIEDVKRHAREGNKGQAIKEYRELTGADLAKATAFVESLE
jgi:ribosomal protein L7/L12